MLQLTAPWYHVCSPMVSCLQGAHKKLEDAVTLQFGKTGEDAFVMDVSYPLSLTQAFGICLALFENDGHA